MTPYQAATARALTMIGMTAGDTEREDFFRRSGVKSGKALRSLGYTRERFPTMGGRAVTQWAAPGVADEFRRPVAQDFVPAFTVLVGVLANNG